MSQQWSIEHSRGRYIYIYWHGDARVQKTDVLKNIGECEQVILGDPGIPVVLDVSSCQSFSHYEDYRSLSRSLSVKVAVLCKRSFSIMPNKLRTSSFQLFDSFDRAADWLLQQSCSGAQLDLRWCKHQVPKLEEPAPVSTAVASRLEVALEASHIGVWEFNIETHELIWDQRMYQLYGVEEHQFSGAYDAWVNGLHPEDIKRSEEELQAAIAGEKKFDTAFRVCLPDGRTRHIRALAKVDRREDGTPYRMTGANWDITESIEQAEQLKKSKEESDRANQAKSEFLSNMSHEIRTPMNGVLGMAELLKEENLTEQQMHLVNTILSSGQTMMTVLNDILDYSKISAKKMIVEKHHFHFFDFIKENIRLFQRQADQKNIQLHYEIDASIPEWIYGDSSRLRQVLSNLLSNALKFTHEGFIKLHILKIENSKSYTLDDFFLEFKVRDSGIGIPYEKQEKVFSIFSQADTSTTRKYGGTGLGLAISKDLVALLGGHLSVQSQPGHGSEFSFSIRVEKGVPDIETASQDETSLSDTRVLLVEDNEVNSQIIIQFLKKMNIYPDVAFHGKEAVEKAKKSHYDVILMDCQMPVMDGYEASRQLRNFIKPEESVIIALTANAMPGEREKCLEAGMDGYLSKPISLKTLENSMKKWVGRLIEMRKTDGTAI